MRALAALAAGVALIVGGRAPAQAMRTERHAFAHAMELRAELLDAWLAAGRAPAATTIDRLREALVVMALPEVCDGERFDAVHVTLHAPRLPTIVVEGLAFDVELRDARGGLVAQASIEEATSADDLMRFRATCALPFGDAKPGEFRVDVFARGKDLARSPLGTRRVDLAPEFPARADALPMLIDGAAPRVAHSEQVIAALPEGRRDSLDLAVLRAVVLDVERAYAGEPRLPGAEPLRDLERAEEVLAAMREDRAALALLRGRVTIAVPIGEFAGRQGPLADHALVSIDCGDEGLAAMKRKPLVLVVPGAPSWGGDALRPDSPQTLHPAWTVDQLARAQFDPAGRFHVAVLESPGRFRSAPGLVRDALAVLRRILPIEKDLVFAIGEREGAYAVSRAAIEDAGSIDAAVLLDGASISRPELEAQPALHVAFCISADQASRGSLSTLAGVLAATGRARLLDVEGVPSSIAIGAHAKVIEAFLRERCGD
ncbi:MAG: hypothetical protein HZB39_00480 [Planctomycetes bacterium]|nr:hypothetical protein [Planctomycetota bacterium]